MSIFFVLNSTTYVTNSIQNQRKRYLFSTWPPSCTNSLSFLFVVLVYLMTTSPTIKRHVLSNLCMQITLLWCLLFIQTQRISPFHLSNQLAHLDLGYPSISILDPPFKLKITLIIQSFGFQAPSNITYSSTSPMLSSMS